MRVLGLHSQAVCLPSRVTANQLSNLCALHLRGTAFLPCLNIDIYLA